MPSKNNIFGALGKHLATYAPTTHQILMRQNQVDDFLQDFMLEVVRQWNKRKPEHPQDFIDFSWYYARIKVTLPSRKVFSLITLRAIRFSKKTFDNSMRFIIKDYNEICDFVDFSGSKQNSCDPYLSIDTQLEIAKLRRYLLENARHDVIDYLDLILIDLEKSEISRRLKLSTNDTVLLQDRFRYYVNRYQGITPYKSKKNKKLVNHRQH